MTPIDYSQRQQRAVDILGGAALLVRSPSEAIRNSDVHHAWRQESLIDYLCGFREPESALLILSHAKEGERVHLFLRRKDPVAELWEGRRLGVDAAPESLRIDKAHAIDELWELLPALLGEATALYCDLGVDPAGDQKLIAALLQHRRRHRKLWGTSRLPVLDVAIPAGELRVKKGPEEVERLRRAAAITEKAFRKVLETIRPGQSERMVHGLLVGTFLAEGAEMEAYPSIVAQGENACILHYIENCAPLEDGKLLLIDAGAQFDYYAADVTRTYPIGRDFTPAQKALYEVCLAAQEASLAVCRPGGTLEDVHAKSVEVIVDGLLEIGLLHGSRDEILEKKTYRTFFPHGTSHWIGMDVHDVGRYGEGGKPVLLEPGHYFSVEPGIYVSKTERGVPEEFLGIGIRIEDDVLVTDNGHEVLTGSIPKGLREITGRY